MTDELIAMYCNTASGIVIRQEAWSDYLDGDPSVLSSTGEAMLERTEALECEIGAIPKRLR